MYRFVAERLAALVATVVAISIIIFMAVRLLPGSILDLFFAGDNTATPQQLADAKKKLGLTGSYPEQYWHWAPPLAYVSFFKDPWRNIQEFILPGIAISVFTLAIVMRMVRATMLEVLNLDYVRTARAKGVPRRTVLVRHALRNALIPVVTVAGFEVGVLISGAAVAEIIFGLPGVGYQLVHAIFQRDYPVVQASVLMIATTFVVVNFFVDILYGLLDPRT